MPKKKKKDDSGTAVLDSEAAVTESSPETQGDADDGHEPAGEQDDEAQVETQSSAAEEYDPKQISAADVRKMLEANSKKDDEESASADDDDDDSSASERENLRFPKLPKEHQGNPEAQKRHAEYLDGIQQLLDDAKSDVEGAKLYSENKEKIEAMVKWAQGLENPETWETTLDTIRKVAAEFHGTQSDTATNGDARPSSEARDVSAAKSPTTMPKLPILNPEAATEWERVGIFASEEDHKYGLGVVKLAWDMLSPMLGQQQKVVQGLQAVIEKQGEAAAKDAWLKKEGPRIQKEIAATYSGWQVTPDMIAEAVEAHPELKPVDAVKLQHFDRFVKYRNRSDSQKTRAYESAGAGGAKGVRQWDGDPLDFSAKDVRRFQTGD